MQIWWIPTVLPTQSHPQHQSPPDKQVCVSNTGWQTNQDIHKISLIQTTFGSWKSAQQELVPLQPKGRAPGTPWPTPHPISEGKETKPPVEFGKEKVRDETLNAVLSPPRLLNWFQTSGPDPSTSGGEEVPTPHTPTGRNIAVSPFNDPELKIIISTHT